MPLKSNPTIGRIRLAFADRLLNVAYRRRFFRGQAQDEIAMQIRALREKRGVQTQAEFGRRCGMLQSAVSRIENAEYQGWTFKTLLKVADALDARLRITFEPAEQVIASYRRQEKASSTTPDSVTNWGADDIGPQGTTILPKATVDSLGAPLLTIDDSDFSDHVARQSVDDFDFGGVVMNQSVSASVTL